ncbi:MAG: Holliday junction resolvase RuvX [Proteobacteria bacterium]|nr:Holliday junction resolvase RuvX [Pseudomonadota bacterium]
MVTRNPLELPASGRILALDVGSVRVGVAISDSARKVAMGRGNWPREYRQLAAEVGKTRQNDGVCAAILGYPLNMDGSEGPMAQAVRDLAAQLEKDLALPVLLWDERLTSQAVEAAWFEQREGRTKKGNKKDSVGKMDAGAAVLILQGVLGALRG